MIIGFCSHSATLLAVSRSLVWLLLASVVLGVSSVAIAALRGKLQILSGGVCVASVGTVLVFYIRAIETLVHSTTTGLAVTGYCLAAYAGLRTGQTLRGIVVLYMMKKRARSRGYNMMANLAEQFGLEVQDLSL
jgi:hypothetical protein